MNNVFEKDGTWSCKVKKIDKATFNLAYEIYDGFETQEEAEAFAKICQKRFEKELSKVKKTTSIRFTFSEYLTYFLENVVTQYGKPSYLSLCNWVVNIVIKPNIDKDIVLEFITVDYINDLLKRCSPLCKSAAPQARVFLSVALGYAYNEGFLTREIMPFVDKYPRPTPSNIVYSREDLRKLVVAVKQYGQKNIYCEFLLALLGGLRLGEIRGLTFDAVNPDEKSITIKQQITGLVPVTTPPKTVNSYRTLKVADIVIEEILERKAYNEALYKKNPNPLFLEYICVSWHGQIKNHATCTTALRNICKENNLPRLTFHDLRHLFATIMFENGDPKIPNDIRLKHISDCLGHKSIGTTLDIYLSYTAEEADTIKELVQAELDPVNNIDNYNRGEL